MEENTVWRDKSLFILGSQRGALTRRTTLSFCRSPPNPTSPHHCGSRRGLDPSLAALSSCNLNKQNQMLTQLNFLRKKEVLLYLPNYFFHLILYHTFKQCQYSIHQIYPGFCSLMFYSYLQSPLHFSISPLCRVPGCIPDPSTTALGVLAQPNVLNSINGLLPLISGGSS